MTMNYNEFMKAIDEKLLSMSELEKTEWIHNMARITKEHERIIFLNSLDGKQDYHPIIYEKELIKKWCREIEDGEIYFECSSYEEYGDSYWDSDYVHYYYDNFGIGKELTRVFQIAEYLLFQKEYEEASLLYDCLCSMPFSVLDKDTEDCFELGLEEIVNEELVILNLKQIALNLMYAKYQTTKGRERTAELYRYFSWDMCKSIKVEEIFTMGPEELKGTGQFMEEWIAFLKSTDGDMAGNLLLEACMYQGGIDLLCKVATEKSLRHPILYKYACEYLLSKNEWAKCEELGMGAINVLPEHLIIRGEVADLTAKAAEQLEHFDIIRECYEAAFYSKSVLNNYLRLFELPNYQKMTDKAAKYANALPEESMYRLYHNNKQMMKNSLPKEYKNVIRFFNGEFDYIYEYCKNDETILGWSSSPKGIFGPLFILVLDKGNEITKAGQQLLDGIIYRLGFIEDDGENLSEQFLNWKRKVVLTNEEYEKYIIWLKEEVNKRANAIVGEGHRKSYYKAAAFITALGETLESNGELNGRTAIIEHYKKLHSRKRAFKAELDSLNG